jgi:proteasome lid subunit RPN8/RPN11
LQALARAGYRYVSEWNAGPVVEPPHDAPHRRTAATEHLPLARVCLTHEVARTLFDEYAAHRAGARGDEETGWILLGARGQDEALVLATLPAGAERHASQVHVKFNSSAQALGSRIVRQGYRQLTLLGVVHTHPGSLRHPSDGDLRGDSKWVGQLRGGEGIFGIGTADAKPRSGGLVDERPKPNVQCLGELQFSWYALRTGDRKYRPMPIELHLGPDLAAPLRPVWEVVEEHAERLDRLACQQARVRFDVVAGRKEGSAALAVTLPLAEPDHAVRVLLEGKEVRYFLLRGGEVFAVDLGEPRVDQGVYLLLAELAGRDAAG